MNIRILISSFALMLTTAGQLLAQGVAINNTNTAADSSAMLDISAPDKGILVPRIPADDLDSIKNPAEGLLVYVIDKGQGFYYYDGTEWLTLGTTKGQLPNASEGNMLSHNGTLWRNSQSIYNKNQKIGIGYNNQTPMYPLDVMGESGQAFGEATLRIRNTNRALGSRVLLRFTNDSANTDDGNWSTFIGSEVEGNDGSGLIFGVAANSPAPPSEAMRLDQFGRLGIGTSSPTQKLHVQGNVYVHQNVGIGVANPSEDLEVAGATVTNTLLTTGIGIGTNSLIDGMVVSGSGKKILLDGGANLEVNNGTLKVSRNGATRMDVVNPSNSGPYLNIYNDNNVRTLKLFGQGSSPNVGGELVLYKSDGTATITLAANVNGDGRITCDEILLNGGSDFAELFDVRAEWEKGLEVKPGMVLAIDPQRPGGLQVCSEAYDRKVAGIVSGANGVKPGMVMGQKNTLANGEYPVALSGRTYVFVDEQYGKVTAGDMLTSSPTPGYAMKASDHERAQGAVIGKAMTAVDAKTGMALVLVTLQ